MCQVFPLTNSRNFWSCSEVWVSPMIELIGTSIRYTVQWPSAFTRRPPGTALWRWRGLTQWVGLSNQIQGIGNPYQEQDLLIISEMQSPSSDRAVRALLPTLDTRRPTQAEMGAHLAQCRVFVYEISPLYRPGELVPTEHSLVNPQISAGCWLFIVFCFFYT